jgi:hypothetical protein
MRVDSAPIIDAPLVFVGHGLNLPEQGINDLEGLNLRGAVVVYLNSAPASLPGPLRAHAGSTAERWQIYRAAGAIGTVSVSPPGTAETPWARSTLQRLQTHMSLADSGLDQTVGQQVAITMNPAHAQKLFEDSAHTFREIVELDAKGAPLPRLRLPTRLAARVAVERGRVESDNVIGILRGTDQHRRDECVVLSAHLDHEGLGQAVNGDGVYNGAMDNAAGVAAMIEVATRLHESGRRVSRSILFVAVTGEEQDALGSRYFVAHPTVAGCGMVANINTDMFLPLFPLEKLMVLGLDESDLGDDIRAVASGLGLVVQSDPEPQRNRLVRSDQYSFIRAGVPALLVRSGYDPDTAEAKLVQAWTAERYHAPSDDVNQPIDHLAAATFIRVLERLTLRIADRDSRPTWNANSFFRRFSP